jgi:hypothetical protein
MQVGATVAVVRAEIGFLGDLSRIVSARPRRRKVGLIVAFTEGRRSTG